MSIEKLMKGVQFIDGCWMWHYTGNNKAYGSYNLHGTIMGVHRASYILHKGEIPEGMSVLHSCDNPRCVNPDHLRIGTQKENQIEMVEKCRYGFDKKPKDTKKGKTIQVLLSQEDANRIRKAAIEKRMSVSLFFLTAALEKIKREA